MPKSFMQYDLLISCPGDVVDEIEIINKCVESFNQTFSGALSPDIVRSTIMVHE